MATPTVLAAIDLTDEADEVLAAARRLADAQAAELHLITVVRPLTMMYADVGLAPLGSYAVDIEKEAVAHAGQQLDQLASVYNVTPDNCSVLLGAPADEIRSHAEQIDAALIVIGTHGRHGLGLILGSTANSVLHGVGCDVYVVRIHNNG